MAHPNIDARRERVAEVLQTTPFITQQQRRDLGREFGCSHAAIAADIIALTRPPTRESAFPSPTTKRQVAKRDRNTCQYCGSTELPMIVEHIIPAAIGAIRRCSLRYPLHSPSIMYMAFSPVCKTRTGSPVTFPSRLISLWGEPARNSVMHLTPYFQHPI